MVWAQREKIDSLESILSSQGQDTTKVNTLLALGTQIFRFEPEEAIRYSLEAIQLAEKIDYQKGQAYALKNMGLAYYVKSDYEKVLNYWKESLSIFQEIKDPLGVSNLLSNIGAVYFNQGNDAEALDYYLESLRESEKLGHKLRIATALTNIGAVYFNNTANHDKALEYHLRAVKISEEIGDIDAIGTSLVNLGEIYIGKGQLDSALLFFEKSLEALNVSGGEHTHAYALNNIGLVHAARSDYEIALEYHQLAYEEALKVEAKKEMSQALIGLGNAYLAKGIDNNTQEDFSLSRRYLLQALEEAQTGELPPEIRDAAEGLYKLFKAEGNYKRSLEYHEIYEVAKDSLLNEEKFKRQLTISAEYEFEKKQQEIRFEVETQLRRQKIVQYATAAGLFIALVFIAIIVQYFRLSRIRAAEKFEAQRQLIMQDKLASLGQITAGIAHEIKNPLNFVTNFAEGSVELGDELIEVIAENEKVLKADQFELLNELAEDLNQNAKDIQKNGLRADRVVKRMMAQARGDKGEPRKVDINTLIDENILLAYHGYRGNHTDFNVHIEKNYDASLPLVEAIPQDVGRVILNIFNNACYALNEKQEQSDDSFKATIKVSTEAQKDKVVIRLWDNGPGIPDKVKAKIFRPFLYH